MPIYGYRCTNCGHQFEIQQRMSDDALVACPQCQGKLTKILYPSGIIFKGSGYYTTDYKDSAKDPAKPASGNGSAPSTESKPESKPESKSDSGD